MNKLFGFHLLEKLAERNEIGVAVLKVLDFYNKYLSFHGSIFKLMDFSEHYEFYVFFSTVPS